MANSLEALRKGLTNGQTGWLIYLWHHQEMETLAQSLWITECNLSRPGIYWRVNLLSALHLTAKTINEWSALSVSLKNSIDLELISISGESFQPCCSQKSNSLNLGILRWGSHGDGAAGALPAAPPSPRAASMMPFETVGANMYREPQLLRY